MLYTALSSERRIAWLTASCNQTNGIYLFITHLEEWSVSPWVGWWSCCWRWWGAPGKPRPGCGVSGRRTASCTWCRWWGRPGDGIGSPPDSWSSPTDPSLWTWRQLEERRTDTCCSPSSRTWRTPGYRQSPPGYPAPASTSPAPPVEFRNELGKD